MNRTRYRAALAPICLLGALVCSTCSNPPEQTYQGVKITVTSVQKVTEWRIPGTLRALEAQEGSDLLVVDLRAAKKLDIGGPDLKAALVDAAGQPHQSLISQVFEFQDSHAEIKILFQVPKHAAVKNLRVGELLFDLTKVVAAKNAK